LQGGIGGCQSKETEGKSGSRITPYRIMSDDSMGRRKNSTLHSESKRLGLLGKTSRKERHQLRVVVRGTTRVKVGKNIVGSGGRNKEFLT